MRAGETMIRTLMVVAIASWVVGNVMAGTPRLGDQGPGIHPLPKTTEDLAPLSGGKPFGLAGLGSWVTSDAKPSQFTTDWIWCETENLQVYQVFTVMGSTKVKATVRVTHQDGTLADSAVYTLDPEPDRYYFVEYSSPSFSLAPGIYKITVKVAQGQKTIGSQYWLLVESANSVNCNPALQSTESP